MRGAGPRSQVLEKRPGPVSPLRLAPGPRPGPLEREPQRLGSDALRGRRTDLRPPGDLLLGPLPPDRRAVREPAPRGAGGRRGPRALARVPGPAGPRPPAGAPAELLHAETARGESRSHS